MSNFSKVFFLVISFILIGCASGPNSKPEKGKSLVVGKIVYEGKDIFNRLANLNGIAKGGIKLYFTRENGKIESVTSGQGGFFYILTNSGERINLNEVKLKRTRGNDSSSTFKSINMIVTSNDSGVTMLGDISWKKTGSKSWYSIKNLNLRDEFVSTYPNNVWNDENWSY
ncbi:hypothetical protein [Veronia pacifica]|uniref:Lipoprotein n=1 Tax=Veronia pacifica TaxID=1080227 RepID=A0A1C3EM83_9GAMM|nr:hypothetical protein [Veronia pacifica]ODA34340.1 hypothetical protein A8L45_06340 [Veronia pacifica]